MRVGRSYFLEYVLSYFCSNSLDDVLQKHIPVNIKNCHQAEKKASFNPLLRILVSESWKMQIRTSMCDITHIQ